MSRFEYVNIATPTQSARTTTITDAEGNAVRGVVKATVEMAPDAIVKATLELFASYVGVAVPVFVVIDPVQGERKAVKRIEWEDGSVFEAAQG